MRANVAELAKASTSDEFRNAVFDFVGDLSGYQLLGNRVLVATYIPSEKTKGGIIRVTASLAENRFTSPVGLVLKVGSAAFKYDGPFAWDGPKPEVGDFIQYDPHTAREFFLGPRGEVATNDFGVSCRNMHSDVIAAIVDDPNRVGRGNGFENQNG